MSDLIAIEDALIGSYVMIARAYTSTAVQFVGILKNKASTPPSRPYLQDTTDLTATHYKFVGYMLVSGYRVNKTPITYMISQGTPCRTLSEEEYEHELAMMILRS